MLISLRRVKRIIDNTFSQQHTSYNHNIVRYLRWQAEKCPNSTALFYFDACWSWYQCLKIVKTLARQLKQLDVQEGDRVILMLQNIPANLFVQLALWWLGAIVVPLNVMYKEDELSYFLKDSGAKGAIVLNSVADRFYPLPEFSSLQFLIDVSDNQDFVGKQPAFIPARKSVPHGTILYEQLLVDGQPIDVELLQADEMTIAYLTYTSGTTGNPKGAINTHQNIFNSSRSYTEIAKLNESDVIIAFAPLFHITGSVAGLVVHLVTGAPLVLLYRFDAALALDAMENRKVTFTVGSITTYLALLQQPDLASRNISSFNKAYSGGAPVALATVEQFEKFTGCYIHNIYGLTESANGMVLTPFAERAPVEPGTGALSVGKIGIECEACIVDLDDPTNILPHGRQGELALRGKSITPGYWNKPDATHGAFVNGWFLTGDVACIDSEGWIYIVDRKKDMIVTSGNKVWPREVEDILYLHPAVKEAAIVGEPDDYRGEIVTAFVALHPGWHVSPDDMIEFVRTKIAVYKAPRKVQIIDEIPKTATGKFLRRMLRHD